MNFLNKINQFFSNLLLKITDGSSKEKNLKKPSEIKSTKILKLKSLIIRTLTIIFKLIKKITIFILRYVKKFIIFILSLINTMMQPMIKISKIHPIAFFIAVILHLSILGGVAYTSFKKFTLPEQNTGILPTSPVQAIMIDMEIIDAEKDRLKDVEKQKQQKLKNEEKRSETAQKDQKVAEQEALKAKAKKIMAELQRKSEEAKTKEAEILASKANEIIADAELKTKIEQAKAKKAEVKRIAEEEKTKEAEILIEVAAKKIELAEAKRKKEEVKTKLAEMKRKVEETKAQEAEILAKQASTVVNEAKDKRIAEEEKTKEAKDKRKLEEEKIKKAKDKRKLEEDKIKKVKDKRKLEEEKTKEAEDKRKLEEGKTKEAEEKTDIAKKLTEEERIKLNKLEIERTEQKLAYETEQYIRGLAKEVQDEQDLEREARIATQRELLQITWQKRMQAEIISKWMFTDDVPNDWFVEVFITQNRDGKILNIKFEGDNVGKGAAGKTFKDSIERAINKSSPLPVAPDKSVWDKDVRFTFSPN